MIFISIILALGIACIPTAIKKIQIKYLAPVIITNNITKQDTPNLDSDSDGLLDWEEALRGTKTNNPDSDGDGTNDGAEISAGRDPLKANTATSSQTPTDIFIKETVSTANPDKEYYDNLSATEKISREIFIQYMNTKNAGIPISLAQAEKIVNNALVYLPKITFRVYKETEINVVPASDNLTLRNYTNKLAEIILANLEIKTESVDAIISATRDIVTEEKLMEEVKVIFQRFDPLIEKNKKTVSSLLAMTVPKIFVNEHLQLLNAFSEIYEKLDLMQKSPADIVTLVMLKSQYSVSVDKLASALPPITKKLASLGVTFASAEDYGYVFFNDMIILNTNL